MVLSCETDLSVVPSVDSPVDVSVDTTRTVQLMVLTFEKDSSLDTTTVQQLLMVLTFHLDLELAVLTFEVDLGGAVMTFETMEAPVGRQEPTMTPVGREEPMKVGTRPVVYWK
jgi:hypothetical protein